MTLKKINFFLFGTKYKKTSLVLFVLLILFASYKLLKQSEKLPFQEEKFVEIEKVKLQAIQQTATLLGTVKSKKQTSLNARSEGILVLDCTSGQSLKKGDLIAHIENIEIKKNYELQKEAEKIASTQLDRASSLSQSGLLSKKLIEEKKSYLLDHQKKLSDSNNHFNNLNIYAPFDGKVGIFKLREGSQININDIIVNFYDPQLLIVEFEVPLSIAIHLQDGARVFIDNDELQLTHVQKMLDEETHMCPAYVDLKSINYVVGATVNIILILKEKASTVVIPFEAVFLKQGKSFVYIIKENKAILTYVDLGIKNKNEVEILSGLTPDDQLVVYGHHRLYPDMKVKIQSLKLSQNHDRISS